MASCMGIRPGTALLGAALLTLGTSSTRAQAPVPPQVDLDPSRLEVVEDLSESLANDLLALSVAARRMAPLRSGTVCPVRSQNFWIFSGILPGVLSSGSSGSTKQANDSASRARAARPAQSSSSPFVAQ